MPKRTIRQNPHTKRNSPYRSNSHWPADICARVYNSIQLKRAENGKNIPLDIPCRAVRSGSDQATKPADAHGRWVFAEKACLRVDICDDQLTGWIEYEGTKEIAGERIKTQTSLTEFTEVYLIDKQTAVNLTTKRVRTAVSISAGLALLSRLEWIEAGSEVISVAEWIPGVGEWAIILGIAASTLVEERSHVVMKTDEGISLIIDIPQYGFHLIDAMLRLRLPEWKVDAPRHLREKTV